MSLQEQKSILRYKTIQITILQRFGNHRYQWFISVRAATSRHALKHFVKVVTKSSVVICEIELHRDGIIRQPFIKLRRLMNCFDIRKQFLC